MYKAIGEAAYNDGLFSQAAPFQAFQASVSQFGDGGLGATSRLVSSSRFSTKRRARGRVPGHHTYAGLGAPGASYADGTLGNAYHDGSLGSRTFLPAFSKRAMQGLGYTFRDGVLGDDVTVSVPGVAVASPQAQEAQKQFNRGLLVWGGVMTLAVGYLYAKR